MNKQAYAAALKWYIDNGVDEALVDSPKDYYAAANKPIEIPRADNTPQLKPSAAAVENTAQNNPLGASDARAEAVKLANAAQTLDDLKQTITDFEGIGLKKTATNLVFSDGNSSAKIMLVGEAPGADEDREGKPMIGMNGQLLDKILACIDLDRQSDDPLNSIYISNILNWRPPGNRTPTPGEIEASLPFIERHIQMINPDILILCGGVAAKALLGSGDGISKLRKKWHNYLPQVKELQNDAKPIKAIATLHPSNLLSNPIQKKAVWADMLTIQKHRIDAGLMSE